MVRSFSCHELCLLVGLYKILLPTASELRLTIKTSTISFHRNNNYRHHQATVMRTICKTLLKNNNLFPFWPLKYALTQRAHKSWILPNRQQQHTLFRERTKLVSTSFLLSSRTPPPFYKDLTLVPIVKDNADKKKWAWKGAEHLITHFITF